MAARKRITRLGWVAAFALAGTLAVEAQDSGQTVTQQYANGGVYEGTMKDGEPDGKGRYTLPNGYVYDGDWIDGQRTGQGSGRKGGALSSGDSGGCGCMPIL